MAEHQTNEALSNAIAMLYVMVMPRV